MDSSPCSRCASKRDRARAPAVCPRRLKKHGARRSRLREERAPPRAGRGSTSKRSMIPSNACDRPRGDVSRRGGVSAARAPRSPPRDARALFRPFRRSRPLGPAPDPRPPPHRRRTGTSTSPDSTRPDQERRGVQAALEDHPHLPRPQRCVPRQIRRPPSTPESTRLDSSRSFVSSQLSRRPRSPRTPDRHEQDGDQPPGQAVRHLGRRRDRA